MPDMPQGIQISWVCPASDDALRAADEGEGCGRTKRTCGKEVSEMRKDNGSGVL
jgi:hypothetical protein